MATPLQRPATAARPGPFFRAGLQPVQRLCPARPQSGPPGTGLGIAHDAGRAATPVRQSNLIIIKSDRLCREMLAEVATRVLAPCEIVCAASFNEACAAFAGMNVDLIISGVTMPDGDVLDFLPCVLQSAQRRPRILLVSQRKDRQLLVSLRAFGVEGIFDASSEGPAALDVALAAVEAKRRYLSPAIQQLYSGIDGDVKMNAGLTPTEQLVFAAVEDGCDDHVAAQTLRMHATAIHSMRRNLHRKLGANHRGELVQLAARFGIIRFTENGVVRPGFAAMLARHLAMQADRQSRPLTVTHDLG